MKNPILEAYDLGQSLWYDNIERRLLENGELQAMIDRGDIRGLTSNPSIFNNAIAKSKDYDSALTPMAWAGYTAGQIFEQLAIEDIQAAADLLRPVYEKTNGTDGYVSLEVSPSLADDTEGTLADARRLWETVARPNLMIKIPATRAGLPAIRQAIAAGINVNITLIFSLARYLEVMEAYLSGLEDRLAEDGSLTAIASVASFFVSRIDSKVDKQLEAIIQNEGHQAGLAQRLRGQAAVANARLAYQEFRRVFESERFKMLANHGARLQRPLWASTSTKNPAYPDTLYVDSLIGPHTINTVPPETLNAFLEHGKARLTIENDLEAARLVFDHLAEVGIDMEQVTDALEQEGVRAFADAFNALLDTVEQRRQVAVQSLGPLASECPPLVVDLVSTNSAGRMEQMDPALWTTDPEGQAEIRMRLGWLDLPQSSRSLLPELDTFASEVNSAGFTHALLLGMGGSSLAPEVMSRVLSATGGGQAGLDLAILDSTEPGQVLAVAERSPIEKTLFIVASKSGTTAEVNAFLDYFWAKARAEVGERAGEHFVAITDPGTSLERLAVERAFRKIFNANDKVGGRYSALTAFGLVLGALLGLDPGRLLARAAWMRAQCRSELPAGRNPGLVLGALLGRAAQLGRDKLTILSDPPLAAVGSWLEQLIAESSGKQGVGIIPIDGEALAKPEKYGPDRLFVYLRHDGALDEQVQELISAGHPVLTFEVASVHDLGAEFFRWEYATAIACAVLGVNAFDQPDVQDSKNRTKAKIAAYQAQGAFDEGQPAWERAGIRAYLTAALAERFKPARNLQELLTEFLALGRASDYVALNVYLPRNSVMETLLPELQAKVRDATGLATTLGFGPRFLHSTGQLHKGGPDNGLFLVITAEPAVDAEIPGQGLSFGALARGQALGDFEALEARGRRAMRLNLPDYDAIGQVLAAM
jgi:transaldolase / glucose-6-phosphate isomerase